jgi:hypothetical protein
MAHLGIPRPQRLPTEAALKGPGLLPVADPDEADPANRVVGWAEAMWGTGLSESDRGERTRSAYQRYEK